MPIVTAQSWSIHNAVNGQMLYEKCGNEIKEMASLTKIMTAYLSITLAATFKLNIEKEIAEVPY